ncbi:hypothetical protein H6G41_22625 [Tolypothrix sp. FACHB-123]|uniref:hypothetical protein n=1 Tax=Tolypothrix sp. FACHB-123 TaxID=2692868 RepID=UPI0016829D36|nr:hypothetical protein [Tolypothrix sp. FACHB-123]MBD2357379.1 hypothetical protein [Tolypothrix sp. FACHB-123]
MKTRILFILLSLFIYGIALSLPALAFRIVDIQFGGVNNKEEIATLTNTISTMTGAELTLVGFFGLLFLQIPPSLGWLANPGYWVSCAFFFRQQYQFSTLAGLISILFGFLGTISAFWVRLPDGSNPFKKLALSELLPGFWLWLAAPALIALVSFFFKLRK